MAVNRRRYQRIHSQKAARGLMRALCRKRHITVHHRSVLRIVTLSSAIIIACLCPGSSIHDSPSFISHHTALSLLSVFLAQTLLPRTRAALPHDDVRPRRTSPEGAGADGG